MKSVNRMIILAIGAWGLSASATNCNDYTSCIQEYNEARSSISKNDLVPTYAAKCFTRPDLEDQMPDSGAYLGGMSIEGIFRFAQAGVLGLTVSSFEMDSSYQSEKYLLFNETAAPFFGVEPTVFSGNEALSSFYSFQYNFNCESRARKSADGNIIEISSGLGDAPPAFQGIQSVCISTKVMEQNPLAKCTDYGRVTRGGGGTDYLISHPASLGVLCGAANDSHAPVDCFVKASFADDFLIGNDEAAIRLCTGAKTTSGRLTCYLESVNSGEPPLTNMDAVKKCASNP